MSKVPVAITICLAAVAANGAEDAGSARAAAPVQRVLHVCDCPTALANDERAALLNAFAKRGFVQGRNLNLETYDFQSTGAQPRRGPLFTLDKAALADSYAASLARAVPRMQAQLVLASGVRVVQGAKEASLGTPLIFWRVTDPVGLGFVDSLAQPGGHATGFSRALERLTVKRLELLKEMLPLARRVGFLYIAEFEHHRQQAADVQAVAASRGVQVVSYALPADAWSAEGLEDVFARMRRDGVDAFLLPDINVQGPVLVALAAKYRLPTIHALGQAVTDLGRLAAYTTSAPDELTDVAEYAVRVLQGQSTAELPVQEPARFELVLNTRAAKAIGVSFPDKFVLRATRIVDR
jgi:putative ABC transport system substrate-binding protein